MIIPKAEVEGKHLLIVERDVFFKRYIESFLKHVPCEFEFVPDGVTALKRIKIRIPHLLIIDAHLPKIDGLSLCRHIHANFATAKVPVLMTGSLDLKAQAFEAGAVGFLQKPFGEQAFFKYISPYLGESPKAAKS